MAQQMDAYIAWINRQLEVHPNRRVVTDLQRDMCDGVVFLQLVEVIGGKEQDIRCDMPLSIRDMQGNINRVLEFLSKNNVKVHHILPKEIMEGKLKAIKRLVLVLASHFKSDTFNQSFPGTRRTKNKLERTSSLVSILSNAAASLADASVNASGSKFRYKGSHSQTSLRSRSSDNFLQSSTSLEVDNPESPKWQRGEKILMSTPVKNRSCSRTLFTTSNKSLSMPKSPRIMDKPAVQNKGQTIHWTDESFARVSVSKQETLCMTDTPGTKNEINKSHSDSLISSIVGTTPQKTIAKYYNTESPICNKLYDCRLNDTQEIISQLPIQEKGKDDGYLEELVNYHEEILDDLGITRTVLLELQNLLNNGKTTEEESSGFLLSSDDSFQEQLIMRNVMLEMKDEECAQLKSEINELKEINIQWSGEKVALQSRLSQQEQAILALKCKLHQYETLSKSREKSDDVTEQGKELQQLRHQLATRNDIIEKQKLEIGELNDDVQRKSELEASLQSKLEIQESKVSNLQKKVQELTERLHSTTFSDKVREETNVGVITEKLNEAKFHRDTQKILREHKNMRTTLHNIRQKFKSEDPVQHAFESIEQSMTSFVDTLSMMETSMQTKENNHIVMNTSKQCFPVSSDNNTTSCDSGYSNNNCSSSDSSECLKVIYYIEKSTTPVLKTSDIGLGWFTLRDFKQVIKQSGKYRYFFKRVDSDFGHVREELFFDDDIVPGYENKVVAWLERNVSDV